jgi:hypothetical protein
MTVPETSLAISDRSVFFGAASPETAGGISGIAATGGISADTGISGSITGPGKTGTVCLAPGFLAATRAVIPKKIMTAHATAPNIFIFSLVGRSLKIFRSPLYHKSQIDL